MTRRPRGIALVLTLLVGSLVVLLITAFVGVNRTNLILSMGSVNHEKALQACMSGYEFVWMRLEDARDFGATAFTDNMVENYPLSNPMVRITYKSGSKLKDNLILGQFLDDEDLSFQVQLVNNVNNPDTGLGVDGVTNVLGSVPPKGARVRVTGTAGSISRTMDVVLQKTPMFDSSMVVGNQIQLYLVDNDPKARWTITSTDPYRNAIRAKGSIDAPDASQIRFIPAPPPPGASPTPLSGGKYGDMLAENLTGTGSPKIKFNHGVGPQPTYGEAGAAANGTFMDTPRGYPIKDLNPGDLNMPENSLPLDPGTYLFKNQTVKVDTTTTYKDEWGFEHTKVTSSDLPVNAINFPDGNQYFEKPNLGNNQSLRPGPNQVPMDGNNGRVVVKGVTIDFTQCTFEIPQNTRADVSGSFNLDLDPSLSQGGARKPAFVMGTTPEGNSGQASALNTTGSVSIDGEVRGTGAVVAKSGDLSMYVQSKLSTTPDMGLALYANGDINLKKDPVGPQPNPDLPLALVPDWSIFKSATVSFNSSTNIDRWMDMASADQQAAVGASDTSGSGLRTTTLDPATASSYWSALQQLYPLSPADMTAANNAYGTMSASGLTLGDAVRLREYFKSASKGSPDPTWLDPANPGITAQVGSKIQNQETFYARQAGRETVQVPGPNGGQQTVTRYKGLVTGYFSPPTNPFSANSQDNARFRGLVYSRNGNFSFDCQNNGLELEGALVTRTGNVVVKDITNGINQPRAATFTYNPSFLDSLLKPRPPADPVYLDQVFWTLKGG